MSEQTKAKAITADTVKGVASLLKAGEAGLYAAGSGLYLKVNGIGKGSWIFRYKVKGNTRDKDGKLKFKTIKLGIGSSAAVTLAQARQTASEHRALMAQGIDPQEHRAALERESAAKLATFSGVAADYIAAHRASWKSARTEQKWVNTLKTHADPVIGDMTPADITTADVLKVLQPIWLKTPETASKIRNRIEKILDAAKAQGLRDGENPARWRGHLDILLANPNKVRAKGHHAALPWADLPAFMAELASCDGTAYRAMEMTILTACRTSEVLNARWDEIDLTAGTWTIPAARMKESKEHRVPLAPALLALLQSLPRIDGNPYLFPGMKSGKPLFKDAMFMALRRMGRDGVTMHGFRSTFRDWAGECTPHPRDVCEQALAHAVGNAVEAAYRRGDLFDKRRALMNDWAAYATRSPAENVVTFKREA